jgi:uncharacterized protein (TIGR03067 family)
MTRRLLPGLAVAVAVAACATNPVSPLTLAGQWAPVSAELGGRAFSVATFGGATLRLTADTYEFAGDRGTYTLLATSVPARMDILGREGPNAGRTIQAIYRLAGDSLTVCYQLGPGERPSDFTTARGSQVLLLRYRRVP